ncbi:EamA family transporter [Nonomuraea sp. NPDC001699]
MGLIMALTSACCFGFAGVAAKALGHVGLGSLQAVWIRLLIGSCLLVPFVLLRRRDALRVPRSVLPAMAAYGLLAVAGAQGMFFAALSRIPVGIALLIVYLAPVLVLLWVRVMWRRRISSHAVLGAVLVTMGLASVVQVRAGAGLDPLGLLFALSAACCLATYFLLSESLAGVDVLGLLVWGLGGGALVLTPVAAPWNIRWAAFLEDVPVGGWQVPVVGVLAWLVLVSTIAAYLTGMGAVRRLSSPLASVLASLEVLVAAVVALIALDERLSFVQWCGMFLVLAGSFLSNRAAKEGGGKPGRSRPDDAEGPRAVVDAGPVARPAAPGRHAVTVSRTGFDDPAQRLVTELQPRLLHPTRQHGDH